VALAALALLRMLRAKEPQDERALWTIVAFAQPLIVALTGLLATETARVWIFLTPLLAFPAGRELARLSPPARVAVYAMAWLLLVLIRQNMFFVAAGPRPF